MSLVSVSIPERDYSYCLSRGFVSNINTVHRASEREETTSVARMVRIGPTRDSEAPDDPRP